jgi:hypothetical protein
MTFATSSSGCHTMSTTAPHGRSRPSPIAIDGDVISAPIAFGMALMTFVPGIRMRGHAHVRLQVLTWTTSGLLAAP